MLAMELTPVESSHIAAIGYLEADRVLLVRFKAGPLYAWPDIPSDSWATLLAAKSKGKCLPEIVSNRGICISKGGIAVDPKQPEQREPDQAPGPLEVIDENAGKCCRKIFVGAALRGGENWSSAAGIVTCGTCGTEFRREMVGPVAHWRIVEHFAVVRPR